MKELLETANQEYFDLCEERHETGAKEYGPLKFLDVNLPEFIYEELADASNYLRYLYIRLRVLEALANERGLDLSAAFTGEVRDDDEVSFGVTSFVPQSEIPRFLPKEE